MKNLTALIAGATGLVGRHILHYLLQDPEYSAVTILTRRSLGLSHPKLQEHIIDFDKLEGVGPVIQGNHIFCCLRARHRSEIEPLQDGCRGSANSHGERLRNTLRLTDQPL